MTRSNIIALVSAFMDELSPLSANDNVVNPLISQHMDYAANRLLELLPVDQQSVFEPERLTQATVYPDHIYQPVPDDFIKLGRIKLPGWSRPVVKVDKEGSKGATMQSYRYMSGSVLRPTAVLVQVKEGKYALELRPVAGNAPNVFLYVKRRLPEALEDNLIDPLVWLIAERVYNTMREADNAKLCLEKVTQFIQFNTSKSHD